VLGGEGVGPVGVKPGGAGPLGADPEGAGPGSSFGFSADCPIFLRRDTFLFLPGCPVTAPESSFGCWPA